MKYIMEHFGTGFISGAAAVLLISFFISMLKSGGLLNNMAAAFMAGITG